MAVPTHPAGSASSAGLPSPGPTHPAVDQTRIAAPFAIVRRGYDPDQVSKHLSRVDAETTILAADRAAALEQAAQLSQQLDTYRRELDAANAEIGRLREELWGLDAARAEIERLRGELRAMIGPPDTVDTMNERLQVMLRLARDEFGEMRATACARAADHAAEIIASVGAAAGDMSDLEFDEAELRGPQDEQEIERMRQEAAAERARLDEEAAARRAEAEEEFRRTLALRCREAMAQVAKMQNEAMRTARRVLDEADERAKSVLADAREAVRRTLDEAQRDVDDLNDIRRRLIAQLEESRKLLARADRPIADPPADDTGSTRPTPAAPVASSTTGNSDRATDHTPAATEPIQARTEVTVPPPRTNPVVSDDGFPRAEPVRYPPRGLRARVPAQSCIPTEEQEPPMPARQVPLPYQP